MYAVLPCTPFCRVRCFFLRAQTLDEQETEAAGAAAAGPGGEKNAAMLRMLQQMGYRIVMPKDGSGQVGHMPAAAVAAQHLGRALAQAGLSAGFSCCLEPGSRIPQGL